MGCAPARTLSLEGAGGHLVDVQVDISQGLVKTALVGRPDAAINESRGRCRAALTNSGHGWHTDLPRSRNVGATVAMCSRKTTWASSSIRCWASRPSSMRTTGALIDGE